MQRSVQWIIRLTHSSSRYLAGCIMVPVASSAAQQNQQKYVAGLENPHILDVGGNGLSPCDNQFNVSIQDVTLTMGTANVQIRRVQPRSCIDSIWLQAPWSTRPAWCSSLMILRPRLDSLALMKRRQQMRTIQRAQASCPCFHLFSSKQACILRCAPVHNAPNVRIVILRTVVKQDRSKHKELLCQTCVCVTLVLIRTEDVGCKGSLKCPICLFWELLLVTPRCWCAQGHLLTQPRFGNSYRL